MISMNDNHYSQVLLFGIGGAIIASMGWQSGSSLPCSTAHPHCFRLRYCGSSFSAAGGFGYLCSRRSSAKIRHQRNQLELIGSRKDCRRAPGCLGSAQASCIEIEEQHQEWEQAFDTIGDLGVFCMTKRAYKACQREGLHNQGRCGLR